MAICTIKLTAGTELVAEIDDILFESEDPKNLWYNQKVMLLKQPILVMPNQEGQLGAMPFSYSGISNQITISVENIFTIMDTIPEVKERYNFAENGDSEENESQESPLSM